MGPYLGSYYGDLWKTRDIDLDRSEGKIKLSPVMSMIEDSTELTDLTASRGVKVFLRTNADCEERYWGLTRNGLVKTDSSSVPAPSLDWDSDGLDSTPTASLLDMAVMGNDSRGDSGRNKLFVTVDSGDIWVLNDTGNNAWTGSWWVTKQSQIRLDSNASFHPIEYFPFTKIGLIGDGNRVHTISKPSDTQNDTVTNGRLVFPSQYEILHILTTPNRAWFLCHNKRGEDGAIVEWDGYSQTYNHIHSSYGAAPLTGVNFQGSPIVLNAKGKFLEYNGQSFFPLIRQGQPVAYPGMESPLLNFTDSVGSGLAPSISARGMVVGEDGLVYINTGEFSEDTYRAERVDGGIWCLNPNTGRFYNKLSLSDSAERRSTTEDAGGIYWVSSAVEDRNILASGETYDSTSSLRSGIWLSESTHDPFSVTNGYFITQYIPADEVKEFWDTLGLRFRRFKNSNARLVVKVRGTSPLLDAAGRPLTNFAAWTSGTTFTATMNTGGDEVLVGDEVEVLRGANTGTIAHITAISGAFGAVQTFTIDETGTDTGGSSLVRFDRWKKVGTVSETNISEKMMNIGIDSSFIQFKVELRGYAYDVELSDLIVTSKPSITLQN